MSTRAERFVVQLSGLRDDYDRLAIESVSNTNPERHPEGSHQRAVAVIRKRRYANAAKARALVERLERLNDKIIADDRRLR